MQFLDLVRQLRHDLEQVPHDPVVPTLKIGASLSLLIATMTFDVRMPARCWIAPEIPTATYSVGETVFPVWPTWSPCGRQPASTTARDAPTAALPPNARARSSSSVKFTGSL